MASDPLGAGTPSVNIEPSYQPTPGASGDIQINVRTLDGKTSKIQANLSWTVRRLKEEFGQYRGHDFSRINLHYKAKRLDDNATLAKYNIEPDSFVQANIRSVGG